MDYLIGQTIRVSATFRTDAGSLVNPDVVALTIIGPTGKSTPYIPANLSLGVFYYDLQFSKVGKYVHHWEGRSTDFEAVGEEEFRIVRDA